MLEAKCGHSVIYPFMSCARIKKGSDAVGLSSSETRVESCLEDNHASVWRYSQRGELSGFDDLSPEAALAESSTSSFGSIDRSEAQYKQQCRL
jgi:hypothetical protein